MIIVRRLELFWPEDSNFSEPSVGEEFRVETENGVLIGNAKVISFNPFYVCEFTVDTGVFNDFELSYSTEHITDTEYQPKYIVELL